MAARRSALRAFTGRFGVAFLVAAVLMGGAIFAVNYVLDTQLAAQFEQENSCQLQIDTFDSNEAMYAKLTAGATGYDVLIPSSYMVKTLVRENRLLPLDHAKLPHLKHVDAGYLKRALDPV